MTPSQLNVKRNIETDHFKGVFVPFSVSNKVATGCIDGD